MPVVEPVVAQPAAGRGRRTAATKKTDMEMEVAAAEAEPAKHATRATRATRAK